MSVKATILNETRSVQKYIYQEIKYISKEIAKRISKACTNIGKRSSRRNIMAKQGPTCTTDGWQYEILLKTGESWTERQYYGIDYSKIGASIKH